MITEQPTSVVHFLKPFQPFFDDEQVTEIVVNEPDIVLTLKNSTWQANRVEQVTTNHLTKLGVAVAKFSNQKWDESNPLLSSSMPDGSRIQLVMPPAVEKNRISLTIRRPSRVDFDLNDFEKQGLFSEIAVSKFETNAKENELKKLLSDKKFKEFISKAVIYRKNIICCGATGSGKTTFMKGIVKEIPLHERLITIEDVRELFLPHQNQVNLLYSATKSGKANIDTQDLLKSCLRMKPDRILLAEVRSEECLYFIRSAASGHPGSITSLHADSPMLAWEQLVIMIKESQAGSRLDNEMIRRLLFMTIDIIIHFEEFNGKRRITEIYYNPEKKYELMK